LIVALLIGGHRALIELSIAVLSLAMGMMNPNCRASVPRRRA